MKIKHELILLIETFLLEKDLEPILNDNLVSIIYEEVYLNTKQITYTSEKRITKVIEYHLDSIRRYLLKIRYKWNGLSAKGIKEGYVYIISNPAWPEYIKVGSSIDVSTRLDTYQTYSPYRDYKLEKYFLSLDRFTDEKELISKGMDTRNEWVKLPLNKAIEFCKYKRDLYRTPIKPEWIHMI